MRLRWGRGGGGGKVVAVGMLLLLVAAVGLHADICLI